MKTITPDDAFAVKRYCGVAIGPKQLYFSAAFGRKYIDVNVKPYIKVSYDAEKQALELTQTTEARGAFPIKAGVAYCYYINCPLADVGMKRGRYGIEGTKQDEKTNEETLILTFRR